MMPAGRAEDLGDDILNGLPRPCSDAASPDGRAAAVGEKPLAAGPVPRRGALAGRTGCGRLPDLFRVSSVAGAVRRRPVSRARPVRAVGNSPARFWALFSS